MRTFLLLVAAVLAAIGGALGILAGTGHTNAVGYGDISEMFAGVTQYPDLQVALGVFNPGDPIADFSEVLDFSAARKGTTLAAHDAPANAELFFFLQKQPLVELIVSKRRLYARVDFSLLRPTLPTAAEQADLAHLQSEIGDRWLNLPTAIASGLLRRLAPSNGGISLPGGLSGSLSPADDQKLLDSVTQAVHDHAALSVGVGSNGDNGVVLAGSIASLVGPVAQAVGKVAAGLGQHAPLTFPNNVPGNYRVGFFADRTGTLRQIDVGLHAGISTAGFGIVVNHAKITISPPSAARPIPLSAVADLLRLARYLLPSSLLPTSLS